jgi:hypothetical protein
VILDTSFLLDLKDGNEDAFRRAVTMHEQGTVQRVAMPSVWELHYGASYTNSDAERRRVRNLLLMYPPVAIHEETARRGAELLAAADRREGGDSGVANEDGLIGAVAERFDEPVLTDNAGDFRTLGVDCETY